MVELNLKHQLVKLTRTHRKKKMIRHKIKVSRPKTAKKPLRQLEIRVFSLLQMPIPPVSPKLREDHRCTYLKNNQWKYQTSNQFKELRDSRWICRRLHRSNSLSSTSNLHYQKMVVLLKRQRQFKQEWIIRKRMMITPW